MRYKLISYENDVRTIEPDPEYYVDNRAKVFERFIVQDVCGEKYEIENIYYDWYTIDKYIYLDGLTESQVIEWLAVTDLPPNINEVQFFTALQEHLLEGGESNQ